MKKLFAIAAVAFAGLCLFSCSSTEGTVYMITDTFDIENPDYQRTGDPTGAGMTLYEEFTDAIIAWDAKYESEWTWTVTTKVGKYSEADEDALEKFQKYVTEHETLFKTYQAKFDALKDDTFKLNYTLYLKLQRIGDQSKELSTVKHTVTCNL